MVVVGEMVVEVGPVVVVAVEVLTPIEHDIEIKSIVRKIIIIFLYMAFLC
jgi:hypothetical protein